MDNGLIRLKIGYGFELKMDMNMNKLIMDLKNWFQEIWTIGKKGYG